MVIKIDEKKTSSMRCGKPYNKKECTVRAINKRL